MDRVAIEDQVQCVKREIAMRERVYPRWVAAGKMSQAVADRELAHMRAVLATLGAQPKDRPELGL